METERYYGLIGGKLGHSYSPAIHQKLAGYDYRLIELTEEKLGPFLRSGEFQGLNVTIPYKKAVIPYCTALTPQARRIGSVNTIVRREDGTLLGHNTDYDGFAYLLRSAGAQVAGKKALVLGTGGASLTVHTVLRDLGIGESVAISRTGPDNYENLDRHADAQIIVNATPVGMYPNTGMSPVDLARFPRLEGAFDLIYNPSKTQFLLDAERRGLVWANGLGMLVAQAKAAAELFLGRTIPDQRVDEIVREMRRDTENIVLIGMPGCGKTTVGKALARRLGRELVDTDTLVEREAGCTIPQIFANEGEEAFRRLEHEVLCRVGRESGKIIATGGGIVTRPENLDPMRQNSTVVFLRRPLEWLPVSGRPISQSNDLRALYRRRLPLYQQAADLEVNNIRLNDTVEEIVKCCQHGSDGITFGSAAQKNSEREAVKMKILVMNGPNLNMLGIREPDIYGKQDYQALLDLIHETCDNLGVEVETYQSNHEGDLVDRIQMAYGRVDGIVINPGAYTHTSVALLDAVKAVQIPTVEVHLSDVNVREPFRQMSYIGQASEKRIMGKGFQGYVEGIHYLYGKYAKVNNEEAKAAQRKRADAVLRINGKTMAELLEK